MFMFCGNLCAVERKCAENSARFPLDFGIRKRYHRSQLHNNCVEEEEYLRKIFREPSVGARWQSEPEKGTLEQYSQERAGATSIGQRGWTRGRILELSSLAYRRGMEAFLRKTTSHADADIVLAHKSASI